MLQGRFTCGGVDRTGCGGRCRSPGQKLSVRHFGLRKVLRLRPEGVGAGTLCRGGFVYGVGVSHLHVGQIIGVIGCEHLKVTTIDLFGAVLDLLEPPLDVQRITDGVTVASPQCLNLKCLVIALRHCLDERIHRVTVVIIHTVQNTGRGPYLDTTHTISTPMIPTNEANTPPMMPHRSP